MRVPMRFLLFFALLACQQEGKTNITLEDLNESTQATDQDGDGYLSNEDCDDSSTTSNPGAIEICDGIDNDCDGDVDEGVSTLYYRDEDGDGFGDDLYTIEACESPEGYIPIGNDCDDQNPEVYPTAEEICDGIDNNCDGISDDGTQGTWYPDGDGDGYGNSSLAIEGCAPDETYISQGGDCDDNRSDIHPQAEEVCDEHDNDCDGLIDEDIGTVYFLDADQDGFGDVTQTLTSCSMVDGYVETSGDCDDLDSMIHPNASEQCNGIDDDCDGTIDEDISMLTWYADTDGDGYGDSTQPLSDCEQPSGYVSSSLDCDDSNININPGEAEICNDIDDDCDGTIDGINAIDILSWYLDADGDGYGSSLYSIMDCEQPTGWSENADDCDDGNANINPGEAEICNDIDDDCDGDIDSNSIDASQWYIDDDCDGFGDANLAQTSCEPPTDHVDNADDCDDSDPLRYPGATELCLDSAVVDHDCDGIADNGCEITFEVPSPSAATIDTPIHQGACGSFTSLSTAIDTHVAAYLPTFMAGLDASSITIDSDIDILDYSTNCNGDPLAAPGNFPSTQAWAGPTSGNAGAARIRGYIHLQCGDPLNYTIGMIGNDALVLLMEGNTVFSMDWSSGQWKRFRYISFPGPGLYAFEIQWSTNFVCGIDPMELIWAPGFISGYNNYDDMCSGATCTYGNGVPIPGFSIIDSTNLLQTTSSEQSSCTSCTDDLDCLANESCNSAGLCE